MSDSVPSTLGSTADDGAMSSSRPRADGPTPRRSFTSEQRLAHLAAYEQACREQQGGAHLRREGQHSSLICEWRRLRVAGVLEGRAAGEAVGRPSAEQAEIARLRRQLGASQQKLATTETALDIRGEAHALSEQISEGADTVQLPKKR